MKTSIFCPLDLTGKVETFSGGARLPRIKGPKIGGKGHQSPTTSPSVTGKQCSNIGLVSNQLEAYFNVSSATKQLFVTEIDHI